MDVTSMLHDLRMTPTELEQMQTVDQGSMLEFLFLSIFSKIFFVEKNIQNNWLPGDNTLADATDDTAGDQDVLHGLNGDLEPVL
jgi:hypothetical protein